MICATAVSAGWRRADMDAIMSWSNSATMPLRGTRTATNRCGSGENFLLTDLAIGRTTVITPRSLEVLTAGVQSDRKGEGDEVEHVFTTSSPRLARFMIACGRFSERVLESKEGPTRVHVYRAEGAASGDVQANVAQSVLSFYKTFWPEYSGPENPGKDIHIIETPTPHWLSSTPATTTPPSP